MPATHSTLREQLCKYSSHYELQLLLNFPLTVYQRRCAELRGAYPSRQTLASSSTDEALKLPAVLIPNRGGAYNAVDSQPAPPRNRVRHEDEAATLPPIPHLTRGRRTQEAAEGRAGEEDKAVSLPPIPHLTRFRGVQQAVDVPPAAEPSRGDDEDHAVSLPPIPHLTRGRAQEAAEDREGDEDEATSFPPIPQLTRFRRAEEPAEPPAPPMLTRGAHEDEPKLKRRAHDAVDQPPARKLKRGQHGREAVVDPAHQTRRGEDPDSAGSAPVAQLNRQGQGARSGPRRLRGRQPIKRRRRRHDDDEYTPGPSRRPQGSSADEEDEADEADDAAVVAHLPPGALVLPPAGLRMGRPVYRPRRPGDPAADWNGPFVLPPDPPMMFDPSVRGAPGADLGRRASLRERPSGWGIQVRLNLPPTA